MKIEYLKPTTIAYFRRVGAYGPQNNHLMESFKSWITDNDLTADAVILGITQDDPQTTAPQLCRYDVCLPINNSVHVAKPALTGKLSGGKYAVFELAHTATAINKFYQQLEQTLIDNHLNILQQPIIERYQEYLVNQGKCELLVPIE